METVRRGEGRGRKARTSGRDFTKRQRDREKEERRL
jgi:hypothetical protein